GSGFSDMFRVGAPPRCETGLRPLRHRRLAFAPGAGAPTVGSGFSDMLCVGAPPSVRTGLPATPPPAGIRTRGGCSYSGFGHLRYVLCRSTAPGAKRVGRQLRRRYIRTRGGCSYSGFGLLRYVSCRSTAPVRNGFATTPPPPAGIRTRGGCSYGGFGLLRYVMCRSTALGANRVAGNSAAGWHSHPGRVLLQRVRASPICSV